jgi:hypothetical protein
VRRSIDPSIHAVQSSQRRPHASQPDKQVRECREGRCTAIQLVRRSWPAAAHRHPVTGCE